MLPVSVVRDPDGPDGVGVLQAIVPTGLDPQVAAFPVLKRWANLRCAYGALSVRLQLVERQAHAEAG